MVEGATVEGRTAHLRAGLCRQGSPRPQVRVAQQGSIHSTLACQRIALSQVAGLGWAGAVAPSPSPFWLERFETSQQPCSQSLISTMRCCRFA